MLSVIIVDYNSIQLTLEYIEHLQDKLVDNDIIHYFIVDNNEKNNSIECLENIFEERSQKLLIENAEHRAAMSIVDGVAYRIDMLKDFNFTQISYILKCQLVTIHHIIRKFLHILE